MKRISLALAMTLIGAAPAMANCSYLGGYYGVGSTICTAGGWLEECTVAGYWSAIGHCKGEDDASGVSADADAQEVFSKDVDLGTTDGGATGETTQTESN